MGLQEEIKKAFCADTLYDVFGVEKTVKTNELKKAYRQKSLLCHPDKATEENKEEFTRKFQILCKCYEVLQDDEKRKIYDETGSVDEDSSNEDRDWDAYWRAIFPKITVDQISDYIKQYPGSEEEREDLRQAYEKSKGKMDQIAERFIGFDIENEDRIVQLLHEMIDAGEIAEYKAFTKESAASKRKRQKRFAREAKRAETQEKSMDDLALMIRQNERKRASTGDDFLASLEAKYAQPKIRKKSSGAAKK